MAGVKGRSGGPRANAGGPRANAGGARRGAGRKPDPPVLVKDPALATTDPDAWLQAAMHSKAVPMKFRLRAAQILRAHPIAPLQVVDALYMKAMRGSVSAQIAFIRPYMQRRKPK